MVVSLTFGVLVSGCKWQIRRSRNNQHCTDLHHCFILYTGIAGSNPAGEWISVFCDCSTDQSHREVLASVMCLSAIMKEGALAH
jgi:hypothetical protein